MDEVKPKYSRSKIILLVLIVAVLFLIVATIFLIFKSKQLENQLNQSLVSATATATISPSKTVVASKTPTVTAKSTKTVEKTAETTTTVSDNDLIIKAIADKFSKNVSDISISISKKDDNNAYGGMSFGDEMGGGYFVAVKQNGTWIIIADGNGTIDCSVLDQYGVPASIVGECFNQETGESVTR